MIKLFYVPAFQRRSHVEILPYIGKTRMNYKTVFTSNKNVDNGHGHSHLKNDSTKIVCKLLSTQIFVINFINYQVFRTDICVNRFYEFGN